jgi:hypothetical protein
MFRLTILVIALLACLDPVTADDQPKAKGNEAVKTSQLKKEPVARTIDFTGSLKLSFPSLATLGRRIDEARLASDPVALACVTRELAVAEKVSGKKAGLSADRLTKEVMGLVKLRAQSKELEAVSLLIENEPLRSELQRAAKTAKQREDELAQAAQSGEDSRGVQGTLIVINLHDVDMLVYTNGVYRGVTPANQTRYYYVDNPPGQDSVFEVRYPDGSSRATWWESRNLRSFRWRIDPNIP